MTISTQQKKQLRTLGHNLKPVITVAQKGLTDNIKAEIERALTDHELIKLKLLTADRDSKKALEKTISQDFNAECIQSIGHVVLLYRPARNPDPRLSNLLRNK